MYPSSTSSSSQGSMGPNGGSSTGGLIRYGSAPSSLLATAADSVTNPSSREFSALGSSHNLHMGPTSSSSSRFFPSSETSSLTSESTCKTSNSNPREKGPNISSGLHRAFGFKQDNHQGSIIGGAGGAGMVSSSSSSTATTASPLVRHSSSPPGFLNHLTHACASNEDNGFPIARTHDISRLNSQLSFTHQETLSQISEETENVDNGLNAENEKRKSAHTYSNVSYGVGPWEDANTIMFSMGPTSKRAKNMSGDIVNLNSMETQFQFGMPQTMLDMSSMDKLLNIPQDSVPCKIRAKRGCATHPRSIAERERRTRISGKLKKLQDLVPNMDKQTSYADMLDLAVQHIKGLQNQVQRLHKELDNCTCGCRKPQDSCRGGKS
ncbi:transcription factor bHLH128-like isoform X3 [Coffea arabica]|uniref:Transcription factor bHLH128-like isoform X3 n=1 Tax=Coffea arabica TaxID=13443 RepID=A0A6P6WV98_COFAR|nr:transcription factor bHLH128-like isoform X1 [Coffea arabica]